MKITERAVLPIARQQYVGYDHSPLVLTTGETLAFEDLRTGFEPSKAQACTAFDGIFADWLLTHPGMLLWRDYPVALRDLKGWWVHCRVVATDDARWIDAALIVEPAVFSPYKVKTQAMSVEEMLVRK